MTMTGEADRYEGSRHLDNRTAGKRQEHRLRRPQGKAPDFVILRMDELRTIVTPEPTYSDAERDMAYRTIVYLAMSLTDLGHNVIIDATGNLRKWRDLARGLPPRYVEVYLKCGLEECRRREEQRSNT